MALKNAARVLLFLTGICGFYPALSETPVKPGLQQIQPASDVRLPVPRAVIDIIKKMSRLSKDEKDIGADIDYSITVLNSGKGKLGKDTMFLVEQLPINLIFYNGVNRSSTDQPQINSQPIVFESKNSGLNFDMARDVAFSNKVEMPSTFQECTYTPAAGYDPAVKHICVNPKGVFAAGDPVSEFTIHLRTSTKR